MTSAHLIRTGIVDNDAWSARSIGQWLSTTGSFEVLWCATTAAEALQRTLHSSLQPELLLVDMALGGISGASVCRSIREQSHTVVLVGITAYDCSKYTAELSQAGAQAIIGKEQLIHDLPIALRAIAARGSADLTTFESPAAAHRRLCQREQSSLPQLSTRELDAVRYADQGFTALEIADRMGVSSNTVSTYLRRAATKLGTVGRAATIRKCRDYDLL